MRIEIPFALDMAKAAIEGRKSCTSRSRRYGTIGDVFQVEGHWFILTQIEAHTLAYIAAQLYRQEGFDSSRGFEETWTQLHARGYLPAEVVYVHHFEAVIE